MQQITHGSLGLHKAAILGYQSSMSIDKLIENIGLEESENLLAKALPIITTRKKAILDALNDNNLSLAGEYAHKTAGSIRLYGSGRLEALLRQVVSLSKEQSVPAELCSELTSEFDAAIDEIQQRLGPATAQ